MLQGPRCAEHLSDAVHQQLKRSSHLVDLNLETSTSRTTFLLAAAANHRCPITGGHSKWPKLCTRISVGDLFRALGKSRHYSLRVIDIAATILHPDKPPIYKATQERNAIAPAPEPDRPVRLRIEFLILFSVIEY
jgi:hypothetical protein